MRTLVTGATGFVGRRLLAKLVNPAVVTRNAAKTKAKLGKTVGEILEWDVAAHSMELAEGAEYPAVINLMGESIACLLYTSPSPRDGLLSRMPSSA